MSLGMEPALAGAQVRYDCFLLQQAAFPIMAKAALVLAALVALVLFFWKIGTVRQKAQIEGPISSWTIPDQWSLASGLREGKPIITRFNNGLRVIVGHSSFKKQVGIAVPFKHPTDEGLPGSEEGRQLYDLEDEIRRRFSARNESLLAGVITTGGMREFVLYTSNEVGAIAKAQQLARETAYHQVQFTVNDDPEWNVFKAFAGQ